MGLFRLLFWIALIAAAFWLWRRLVQKKAAAKPHQTTLPMVRCAQCGLHLPDNRALRQGNLWYCSQAHLQQGPGASGR